MGVVSDAAGWPRAGLDEAMLAADPHAMFDRWMTDIIEAGLPEPTAMVLATVSAAGQPRARMGLLKGHAIHRQVIVEGPVTQLGRGASEAYFRTRPRGSQLAAWASEQSTVVGSRRDLEQRYAEMERRWPEGTDVPLPEFWGGYLVSP